MSVLSIVLAYVNGKNPKALKSIEKFDCPVYLMELYNLFNECKRGPKGSEQEEASLVLFEELMSNALYGMTFPSWENRSTGKITFVVSKQEKHHIDFENFARKIITAGPYIDIETGEKRTTVSSSSGKFFMLVFDLPNMKGEPKCLCKSSEFELEDLSMSCQVEENRIVCKTSTWEKSQFFRFALILPEEE